MMILSPSSTAAMGPPAAASRDTWPDTGPPGGAGEAPVGDQGTVLVHPTAYNKGACHVHLPHPRTTLGPLVPDDQHVPLLDLVVGHRPAGLLHGGEDPGLPLKVVHAGLDPRLFHHCALGGQIAREE